MLGLAPFWRYYGGKWRMAPRYPAPRYRMIIEPFAGAAGYSLRYPDHDVRLVDRSPIIAGIWRYLIAVSAAEIRAIPEVEHVDALPAWVPQEARWLVGFWLNAACVTPCKQLSAGLRRHRSNPSAYSTAWDGWTRAARERIASQVDRIRHWTITEGEYWSLDGEATWFIDPPYNNRAGSYYPEQPADFAALGTWCSARSGQVIVCENEGATWLPFVPFATFKAGVNGRGSPEVIWVSS